jgi:hypothetical protein
VALGLYVQTNPTLIPNYTQVLHFFPYALGLPQGTCHLTYRKYFHKQIKTQQIVTKTGTEVKHYFCAPKRVWGHKPINTRNKKIYNGAPSAIHVPCICQGEKFLSFRSIKRIVT